jgi:hypothetical protein
VDPVDAVVLDAVAPANQSKLLPPSWLMATRHQISLVELSIQEIRIVALVGKAFNVAVAVQPTGGFGAAVARADSARKHKR